MSAPRNRHIMADDKVWGNLHIVSRMLGVKRLSKGLPILVQRAMQGGSYVPLDPHFRFTPLTPAQKEGEAVVYDLPLSRTTLQRLDTIGHKVGAETPEEIIKILISLAEEGDFGLGSNTDAVARKMRRLG